MSAFTYNHLFIALAEDTITRLITDIEVFLSEWDGTYDNYGDKQEYEKFLEKIKAFYSTYYQTAIKLVDDDKANEAWDSIRPLLKKLEKSKFNKKRKPLDK